MLKLLQSEEHSDCTIICGPYHFKVHKLAIGAQSEYFRIALKANTFQVSCMNDTADYLSFLANLQQEGKTGTIELKAIEADSEDPDDACDDPEIVKLMVGYFYHLDYLCDDNTVSSQDVIEVPDSPAPPQKKKQRRAAPAKRTRATMSAPSQVAPPPGSKVHLIEHAKVFAMAVEYHVDALRNMAVAKFRVQAEEHWDHEDLAHAIHVVYTSTADEVTQLREVAAEVLNAHRSELLEKAEIATLLRTMTGLACDLLTRNAIGKSRVKGTGEVVCYGDDSHRKSFPAPLECSHCGQYFVVCPMCEGDPSHFQGGWWGCPHCGKLT